MKASLLANSAIFYSNVHLKKKVRHVSVGHLLNSFSKELALR